LKVLVTGAAGFIGMHVAERLLARGDQVVGLDNLNDYYDVALKEARLARLQGLPGFRFVRLDLADAAGMATLFASEKFDKVVHLAAQAGVRYSLQNPLAYVGSNLAGFAHVLEGCRQTKVAHLVFASSSSVYGGNEKQPFAESDAVDHPLSLYAATKKSNELMAHSYAHLFGLPMTGLRFFTVYGPWGRPDMAYYKFAQAITAGNSIDVYNHGKMQRDFTYIDDIVEGVLRVLDRPATANPAFDPQHPDAASSRAPYRLYNIGGRQVTELEQFIATLEAKLGKAAVKNYLPLQDGDVLATSADVSRLEREFDFVPRTTLADGLSRFVAWFRDYHRL
jgi:UDP-glucuronate 4-epimerase